jgi:exodeoxyribonuclease VII large subunit
MTAVIGQYKNRLSHYSEENLTGAEKQKIKDAKHTLAVLSAGLDGVSPLKKLGGGFGYISMDGRNINSAAELKPGDLFDVRLSDGSVTAEAKSVDLDSSDLDSEDAGTGRRIQGWQ